MAYKMAAPEAPPSSVKSPKPEAVQKDSSAAANQDKLRKTEPAAKSEEYGYIVTNQRCSMSVTSCCSTNQDVLVCVSVCVCLRLYMNVYFLMCVCLCFSLCVCLFLCVYVCA